MQTMTYVWTARIAYLDSTTSVETINIPATDIGHALKKTYLWIRRQHPWGGGTTPYPDYVVVGLSRGLELEL